MITHIVCWDVVGLNKRLNWNCCIISTASIVINLHSNLLLATLTIPLPYFGNVLTLNNHVDAGIIGAEGVGSDASEESAV